MKAKSKYYTLPKNEQGFIGLYVLPCYETAYHSVEQLTAGEDLPIGSFYGLYGNTGHGREHIGDFTTFEAACAIAEKLGGVA